MQYSGTFQMEINVTKTLILAHFIFFSTKSKLIFYDLSKFFILFSVIRRGFTFGVVIFLMVLAKRILMAVEKRYGVGKAVVDFINPFLHKVAKYISGEIYGKFYNHRELVSSS